MFSSRRFWIMGFVLLLAKLPPFAPLMAQVVTGAVVGTLLDASGRVMPGVSVQLFSDSTGARREVATDESGNFVFNAMPPGAYTLVVELIGFRKYEKRHLELTANDRLSVGEIRLELGAVADTVTVTAGGATLQTASGERSGIITSDEVENLTVINRDFSALVALLPGVVDNPGVEAQGFSGNATFNVLGNRSTGNNITIDGAPNENTNGGNANTFISMDSVAQVKILVSNYQAEFGRKPGAGIQAVTKSGTRDFHGALYWYKRHEQFNAHNFFNNRLALPEAPNRYTTAGFNIGGPLYIPGLMNRDRKKLFFFASTEQIRETRAQPIRQVTMPTESERRGDFSDSRDLNGNLIIVRDPQTQQPFPGNVIPSARISPIGQNYLRLLPLPNVFDTERSGRRYNYQIQESLIIPKHSETVRIDYNLSENTMLYGRFNLWWENIQGFAVPAGNTNWGWLPSTYKNISKSVVLSATHIFSPTLLQESSMGITRWIEAGSPLRREYVDRLDRTKSGVTISQFYPENNPLNLAPQATFGGITGAASTNYERRFPLRGAETILTWNTSFTKTYKSHVLKAGVAVERWREIKGENGNFAGTFHFDRDSNNPSDSNHPYANALLGNFASYTESNTRPPLYGYTTSVEWFGQDTWTVSRKLTVDLGLRFGWSQPFHSNRRTEAGFLPDRFDRSRAVALIQPVANNTRQRLGRNPLTGEVYQPGSVGAIAPGSGDPLNGTVDTRQDLSYPQGLRYNSGLKLAPRFGFAYDPFGKGKTAIRGGFGIFYEIHERDNFSYGFTYNPPLREDPIIYYDRLDSITGRLEFRFPSGTSGIDPKRPLGRVMNYSFGIQQSIGFGTVLDVSYVAALGRHLLQRRNLNSVPFGANFLSVNRDPNNPNNALPAAFLRPYVGYNDIFYYQYDGNSNYHSMQVTANRRFAKGIQFGAAWTWSKALDYTDNETGTISSLVSPKVWNYGKAGFDRTHILKLYWTWDLPKASRLWSNGLVRNILDDWQLSGIATFVSGAPLGIGLSFSYTEDITGSPTDGARVVMLKNPNLPKSQRTFDRNFATDAFGPPKRGTYGNTPKDPIRGPGINNWDVSLFKNIPLESKRFKLQFRGEFYNLFNHTQFNGLDTGARFDRAGRQVNARFGEFTSARSARRIQLALRLTY